MLCVTMTIVYFSVSVRISSSMRSVAIGSSAEQGSSIRITSGATATTRAMHRRCCWPRERASASWRRRILHLVPQVGGAQAFLHDLGEGAAPVGAQHPGPEGHVVEDGLREGLGRWNTMPTRMRSSTTSVPGAYTSMPSMRTVPCARAPGIVSFIRLRQRRKVDLPQPDGPMRAVICRSSMSMDTSCSASRAP